MTMIMMQAKKWGFVAVLRITLKFGKEVVWKIILIVKNEEFRHLLERCC